MSDELPKVRLGADVYISPTAYVCGDVVLGDQCTIMHHVALRGDIAPIRLGLRTNVQDGAVLHTRYAVPLEIADEVVIGHRAVVHCRSIGRRCLIGIGAIVLDNAEIGPDCLVAAGAVVTPGTRVPPNQLLAGIPAKVVRPLADADRAEIERIVLGYVELNARYRRGDFPAARDC